MTAEEQPVESIAAWIPVSYQMILDAGSGSEELLQWARERQAEDDAEHERYWRSLPWRVRAWRTLRSRYWRARDAAVQALHDRLFGSDYCEREW